QAGRPDLREVLVEGGRSSQRLTKSRLGSALVFGQVALAVTLMIGCGLLLRSFVRLQSVQPGFDPANVLTFRIQLPFATYPNPAAVMSAHKQILDQLHNTPGVRLVGSISHKLPLTGSGPQTPYAWDAETLRKWESISADWRTVSPDYF